MAATASGQVLKECRKGCGRKLKSAGLSHHEKFCTGPGYVPGYSWRRRAERRISAVTPEVKYTGEADMVYELFYDDAALFSAAKYLLAARDGEGECVLRNLESAKDMIDIKIRFLKS